MTDATPLLEARGVHRRAPKSNSWLLHDVSIEIDAGSRVAIVGPTGSGKTLLLRALARLDPIDSGQILWHGKPISGSTVPQFRQHAIYLHQRPALVEGSVEENLRLPFTLRNHRHHRFCRDAVLSLIQRVHRSAAFLSRSSRDLSGGEAQIVALVRTIQLQPTLLLLDEPTAALDDASTRLIEDLVTGWFDESPAERAFVWVSHDREQVARLTGRVMRMRDGCLSPDQGERQEERQ